jgi:hypothetical protein
MEDSTRKQGKRGSRRREESTREMNTYILRERKRVGERDVSVFLSINLCLVWRSTRRKRSGVGGWHGERKRTKERVIQIHDVYITFYI